MQFLASLCLPGLGFEMVKGAKHATDFSGHVNLAATIRTNLGLKQFRHPPNYLDCLEFGGACSHTKFMWYFYFLWPPSLDLSYSKQLLLKGRTQGSVKISRIFFTLKNSMKHWQIKSFTGSTDSSPIFFT